MRSRTILAFTTAAVLGTAALAGCSSSDKSSTDGSSTPATSAAPSASAMAAGQQFGAGCAAVPTDPANAGSFDAMAKVPVATAASGNPVLSTLVTAVTKAGLGDSLNSSPHLTVFAPSNDAFAKVPADQLNALLADKDQLTKVLTYHVVPEQLSPDQLAGTHKTLEGADLTVTGSGDNFTVDGKSMVICGNVQTANATVYIVDSVLMPTS